MVYTGQIFSIILIIKKIKLLFLFPNRCGQKFIEIPLIIKSDENTWDVTKETFDILSISIHEEVRTKLIFRVRMSDEAV